MAALIMTTAAFGQKTINKTFDDIDFVGVNIASGSAYVKKSNSNQVKVTVEYTYDDDDYTPEFDVSGSRLRVKEEFGRGRRNWNIKGKSTWTFELPDGIELDLNTGSGNVEVVGLEVRMRVSSGSGSIEVENTKGDSRVNTGSGNISITQLTGEVRANTGSGNIRIREVEGDSDLNTGSGNVRATDVTGKMRYNTGSGRIDAENLTITDHSRFSTGSGNVDVSLGAALDHDLILSTGSGNATLDFNGQKIEGIFFMEASSKSSISAPFDFDKSYESDEGYGRNNRRWVKEATIGSKDVRIDITTGSGNAKVRQ